MNNKLIWIILILMGGINILCAEFDLNRFTNPDKYNWESPESYKNYREDIEFRKNLLQIYSLKKMDVKRNILKSMFLPGLGHYSTNNYFKGHLILASEIILFGSSLYYYDQAMDKYDKYKNAEYIVDINNYYEDAKKPFFYSKLFAGLGLAVWLYNIYDTWKITNEYNNLIWNDLYKSYKTNKIILTPTGISVRF